MRSLHAHRSCSASFRAAVPWGHPVGSQPARALRHQEGAAWELHRETAGPLSSGHHPLRQPPPTGDIHGLWHANTHAGMQAYTRK